MTLDVRPIRDDFGAEIAGIDLAATMSDALISEILAAYYAHSLLLFRGQHLTPAHQARLAHCFGTPKIETRKQFNLPGHPEVSAVGNIMDEKRKPLAFFNRQGVSWHTDGVAACHVDAATFLYAVEVPSCGGDTLFASTYTAYETLPRDLRERLIGRRALHSFHQHNDEILERDSDAFIPLTSEERAALPDVWHDLIQTHPVTGRKAVYFAKDSVKAFDGLRREEGERLLEELEAHVTRRECVYRHAWRPGDLIIWDNHATMHSATEVSYAHERRLMHRSFIYTLPTARPLPQIEAQRSNLSR